MLLYITCVALFLRHMTCDIEHVLLYVLLYITCHMAQEYITCHMATCDIEHVLLYLLLYITCLALFLRHTCCLTPLALSFRSSFIYRSLPSAVDLSQSGALVCQVLSLVPLVRPCVSGPFSRGTLSSLSLRACL